MMIMLQLFDEGRITDSTGETLEVPGAIFIMTSNLASHVLAGKKAEEIFDPASSTINEDFERKEIRPLLKSHFKRSEFLGRINETVFFVPFSKSGIRSLVERELAFWSETAKTEHDIAIHWEDSLKDLLIKSYKSEYGVRSIKSAVESRLVNELAKAHCRGAIGPGATVTAGVDADGRIMLSSDYEETLDGEETNVALDRTSLSASV